MDRATNLLIGGSALALLFVCSGLGGVIAYGASQRAQQEQGQREQLAQQREAVAREAAREAAAEAERQAHELQLALEAAERSAAAAAAAAGTPSEGAASSAADRSTAVREVVRGATAGARRCYERTLARQPNLSVRADVAITYGLDGSASLVQVGLGDLTEGPIRSELERCLAELFSRTSIPAGTETLSVNVPLVFQSS